MKKVFALILTMLLVLSMLSTATVFAQSSPTVIVDNAKASVGDTVKITVSVKNNPGIMGMQLKFGYDSNALKFEGATEADFKGLTYGPTTKNPFISTWLEPLITENNTSDGTFIILEFTVLDTAPNGKSEITVSYNADDVFNIDFDNVAFEIENGYVDIINSNSNQQQDSSKSNASSGQTNSSQITSSQETGDNTTQADDSSEPSANSGHSQYYDADISKDIVANDVADNDSTNIDASQNDWLKWIVIAAIVVLGVAFVIVILKSKKDK